MRYATSTPQLRSLIREQGLESAEPGQIKWNPHGRYWHIGLDPDEAARWLEWPEQLYGYSLVIDGVGPAEREL